ncbi:MAG TPA: hypothetical protein PLI09_01865 [Candidatus Hydrogenedentes bacterium]|nr:hypothetical protein [Candidatus Hydrogenedentota bacterium]
MELSSALGCGKRILGAFVIVAAGMFLNGCPPPPVTPANLPLIVGMEYALPGMGSGVAQTRLPGVKFMPDIISWGNMQASANDKINFRMLDRLVKEYQGAGFAECMIGLKSESDWASIAPKAALPDTNFAPKPEYMDDYAAWVRAVVERYDGDGVNDMKDLKHPIRYYEIGVEFSTYEPEPAGDYLGMLEVGYQAAHEAFSACVVMHAAFLVATAFYSNPGPEEYPAAFAAVDERIMYHPLEDIRAVLDHPEWFDAVNFHAGAEIRELEATIQWLRYEMGARSYDKPLVISDTVPTPFIGWGPGTTCEGVVESLGIVLAPAVEADRCRLADYFTNLVNEDPATLDWVHGFVAADMTRMVVSAADQGIEFINTSFMEDLWPLNTPLFRASAGNTAWAGMVQTALNFFTQEHNITGYRPLFYALQQLARRLDNYNVVERIETDDPNVWLFRVLHTDASDLPDFWIAWYDPGVLVLPGDVIPETTLALESTAQNVVVETLITQAGQTTPQTTTIPVSEGVAVVSLTPTPVFIAPTS